MTVKIGPDITTSTSLCCTSCSSGLLLFSFGGARRCCAVGGVSRGGVSTTQYVRSTGHTAVCSIHTNVC